MKQILLLKYADIAGQALMLLPLLFIVSPGNSAYAALSYLTVAFWQTMSCVIVVISEAKPVAASRRFYGHVMVCFYGLFVAVMLLTLAIDLLPPAAGLLSPVTSFCKKVVLTEASFVLFLEPVMAIWYAVITLEEITKLRLALRHRAEIHWKL
jgi:hypothetical protein